MLPLLKVKVRTLSGNLPESTDTAASAGVNDNVMSISPSFSSWRCAAPFSGNCRPWRQSIGRSRSYHGQSGAVTRAKLSSVAACWNTSTSGTSS